MQGKRAVLIVDDNKINRDLLVRILSDTYTTVQAENGLKALELIDEYDYQFSAIMLDIVMPVMDGYDFLRKRNQDDELLKIPIIVTTQKEGDDVELIALSMGASDFITKPYNPEIIKHRLDNLVNLRETYTLINLIEKDQLTGLLSKAFFYQNVNSYIEEHPDKQWDIVCCDVDRFKFVNDIYGTKIGDELLAHIAICLQEYFGHDHIYGRLDADTFGILMPHNKQYSQELFEHLNAFINRFPIPLNLTLRYGIYVMEKDEFLPASVMCDRALLAADMIKGKYGVYFTYYDDAIRQKLLLEQNITDSMASALREGQFQIYLQPKYDLLDNSIAGAEALVRWAHPQRGFISPAEFIPLFERNGFIVDLDRYVWEESCKFLRAMLDQGMEILPISVNVSRIDIYNIHLPETFLALINKYHLQPWMLHLEITETAYTENSDQIVQTITKLKEWGFVIEMDDFGSGYSSLNMLSVLPIDILKLDMKFIQNESERTSNRNILSFVISLAKWMDLLVIAEGVEQKEQVDYLRNMDCNFVQGYYFARPMPMVEYLKLLTSQKAEEKQLERSNDTTEILSAEKNLMLIVDDAEVNRKVLKEIFKDHFHILEASDGTAALTLLAAHKEDIQVILLDLVMPKMDGFAVLAYLDEHIEYKGIPVVVTSQTGSNGEVRALSMGASDFISKPYNPDVCRCRINNVVALSHIRAIQADRENREKLLLQEAYIDYLTGVYNRRGFEKALAGMVFSDPDLLTAIYMVDLDNLKTINDCKGHFCGDQTLQSLAELIQRNMRREDIVARFGGDEFVMVMKGVPSEKNALENGKRLCTEISEIDLGNGTEISCSIGVATFKGKPPSLKSYMERADSALYKAKSSGKNMCCLWDQDTALHLQDYDLV